MDAFEETSSEIGRTPISDLLGHAVSGHCVIHSGAGAGVMSLPHHVTSDSTYSIAAAVIRGALLVERESRTTLNPNLQ